MLDEMPERINDPNMRMDGCDPLDIFHSFTTAIYSKKKFFLALITVFVGS